MFALKLSAFICSRHFYNFLHLYCGPWRKTQRFLRMRSSTR